MGLTLLFGTPSTDGWLVPTYDFFVRTTVVCSTRYFHEENRSRLYNNQLPLYPPIKRTYNSLYNNNSTTTYSNRCPSKQGLYVYHYITLPPLLHVIYIHTRKRFTFPPHHITTVHNFFWAPLQTISWMAVNENSWARFF